MAEEKRFNSEQGLEFALSPKCPDVFALGRFTTHVA
jgi:hypothetical protein